MAARKPPRNRKPLKDRTKKERLRARKILHGSRGAGGREGQFAVYDPDVHPAQLVAYFRKAYDDLQSAERIETKQGDVKYVQKPVDPPTFGGFAAEIGVCRDTIWEWSQKHPEFERAHSQAKSILEHILVAIALKSGFNHNATALVLKNLLNWTDKQQVESQGKVIIKLDQQDMEA